MITFKYRLYPNKEQQDKLWKHANKLNYLYNYFLNQKIEAYKDNKKFVSKFDQQNQLPALKAKDPILSEIHSQVLQQVAIRLDKSFKDFFRRNKNNETPGFPKFRSCSDFFGICYPQSGYSIEKNVFTTKAYNSIKFKLHRKYKGSIKQLSITFNNNMWFLNITTDYIYNNSNNSNNKEVGIDIGLTNLVVTSDGNTIKNSKHYKYFDKQIAKVQSKIDKKKKGSKNCKYLRDTLQELHDAKSRKTDDFQHKVSKNLAREYDTIFAEDLSVKHMSEGKITSLNKSIRNAKLAQLISFLSYKANNLILVDPRNTSKMCNSCKKIHNNLKLSDRTITCSCGVTYDRDENAAKNIFCLGQTMSKKTCT